MRLLLALVVTTLLLSGLLALAQRPEGPSAPLEITRDYRQVTIFMDRLPPDAMVLIASDIGKGAIPLRCYPREAAETSWVCRRK